MSYGLTTFDGEVILKINSETIEDAVDYFSKIKRLSKSELLHIFDVIMLHNN
jgi:hypothetical protein